MVELGTHSAIERAGLVTLRLQLARRSSIPTRAAKCLGIRMPTLFIHGEGNTGGRDIASTRWTCEVKDP
jgi:hypothetical protein